MWQSTLEQASLVQSNLVLDRLSLSPDFICNFNSFLYLCVQGVTLWIQLSLRVILAQGCWSRESCCLLERDAHACSDLGNFTAQVDLD